MRRNVRELVDLEVFLFQGVPERPNPVYGRDSFSSVASRMSREIVNPDHRENDSEPEADEELWIDLLTGDFHYSHKNP
jgi:hypothetical protein